MIEMSMHDGLGGWSPGSVPGGIDRLADRTSTSDRTSISDASRTAVFERALTEELLRDGGLDARNLQNGALLNRAGEALQAPGAADRNDAGAFPSGNVVDDQAAAGRYWRVAFEADHGAAGKARSEDRPASLGRDPGADAWAERAFWIGDHIAAHPSSSSIDASGFVGEPVIGSDVVGRVFFNGDGRPIVLPPVETIRHESGKLQDASAEGDLMILPNGAVLTYDPWTAAI